MNEKVLLVLVCLVVNAFFSLGQDTTGTSNTDSVALVHQDTVTVENPLVYLEKSDRVANYKIKARFNPNDKTVEGDMEISWRNYSQDTIRELQFHLYLNAFKNSKSTFFREAKGHSAVRGFGKQYPDSWGYVEVISMKVKNGEVLTDKKKYIQPDDNNKDDETVASYPLTDPVRPGETIVLKVAFESKLPKVVARTGYAGKDFYMVAQWFPKLGVYEPAGWRYAKKGQWNCHQFHANSEFYANFGNYDVEIAAPKDYIIGATGLQASKPTTNGGLVTHHFKAHDVIDFAWTASPKYIKKEDQWEHVKLILLIQKEHESQADRYFHSAKATLAYFKKHMGEYPYETLTLVDPPRKGRAAGGMEYPTLVTLGTVAYLPDGFRPLEMVTVHEIGHQYFMGILASNEFEEPWLDEGFNTYWENRIMDATYGKKTSFIDMFGFSIGDEEFSRMNYVSMRNPKIAENYRASWQFTEGGYGTLTYQKAATWLQTLHNMVGDSAMTDIWKTYYARWRFRHPSAPDFIKVVNEVVRKHHGKRFGENMDWYFDQFLYGSNVCDYSVASISNGKPLPEAGYFDENGSRQEKKYVEGQQKFSTFISKVVVNRLGEVMLPVDIRVHFEDGTEETLHWDGRARSRTFYFTDKETKVLWAKIDPEQKITMDINRINNSKHLKPSKTVFLKYSLKLTFWVQNIIELFAMLA